MNEMFLSKRLTIVANQIPKGSKLADIGSDHAYLPCYALKHGLIKSAIAGEVNQGPFQSAVDQVKKLQFETYIEVRKGNGLEVLLPDEVDVVTIAGMGGPLISTILEEGKDKLTNVKRLILQPNVAANQVRIWLEKNNWILTHEEIVEDDTIIYEILVADKTGISPYSDENYPLEILLGPHLMLQKNDSFVKKWNSEIDEWKKIVKQFEKAKQTKELEAKKQEMVERIQQVEEVLQ